MKELIAEAFRTALVTEISSHHLYRNATATVADEGGRELFLRLCREQAALVDELMKKRPKGVTTEVEEAGTALPMPETSPAQTPRQNLFNHLRVALLHRYASIDRYRTYLEAFREPTVCEMFRMALETSRAQYRLISAQYRLVDQELNRPGANRRMKRIHLKGLRRASPNEHSQLYHSLNDSGSQLPL